MGSQHNELRRAFEIADAIKSIVGETDSESTVERFGETLTPILDVWRQPEWSFLRREKRWATQPILAPAVAAQFSFVQIFNPSGSGRLVVVEGVSSLIAVVRVVSFALTVTVRGATGGGSPFPTDTRWGVFSTDSFQLTFGSSAAFGSDIEIARGEGATAGIVVDHTFPTVILAPGTGVVVSDSVVNDPMTVWFRGYSRAVRPDEIG